MAVTTTTQFIADVRRAGQIPNSATPGNSDADILRYADLEMETRIYPLMLSNSQEYNVQTQDFNVQPGKQQYRMPHRSIAGKLRDTTFIMGSVMYPLPKIEIEELPAWTMNQQTGIPSGFFLKAGSVNLQPIPGSQGVLRMQYFCKHGQFVLWTNTPAPSANARAILTRTYSTTNQPNDTIALTTASGMTFTPGLRYDIIAANPPCEHLGINLLCTVGGNGTGTFIVDPAPNTFQGFQSPLSPNIEIGDIVALAEQMPIIPLAMDMYQLLVVRTCIAVMGSLGDTERVELMEKQYAQLEERMVQLYSPRVEGATEVVRGMGITGGTFGFSSARILTR